MPHRVAGTVNGKQAGQQIQLPQFQLRHVADAPQIDAQHRHAARSGTPCRLQDTAVPAQHHHHIRAGVQLVHRQEGERHTPPVHAQDLVPVEGRRHDLAGVRRQPQCHLHRRACLFVYIEIGYKRDPPGGTCRQVCPRFFFFRFSCFHSVYHLKCVADTVMPSARSTQGIPCCRPRPRWAKGSAPAA